DVQKREQAMVRLSIDAQIVEPVAARQRRAVEESRATRATRLKQRSAALAEEIPVAQLVHRVLEIETTQQRIRRHFRGAQDVAPAVGFHFREREELANTAVVIAPHPAVQRTHHTIEARSTCRRHPATLT